MQINLQIHIHLEGVDVEGMIKRLMPLLAPQSAQPAPVAPTGAESHATTTTTQEAPILPATEAADVVASPPQEAKRSTAGKRAARLPGALGGLPEPESEPAPGPKQRNMTTARLPFDAFDTLVRSEMKRLSMDKRIPGHTLWNAERDPRLPTLTAVCYRYDVATIVELATKLGMQPPLSATLEQVSKVVEP